MCRLFNFPIQNLLSALIYLLFVLCLRELLTKHAFDKVFPVPQFTFNHNNLSYYYGRFYG